MYKWEKGIAIEPLIMMEELEKDREAKKRVRRVEKRLFLA